MENNLSIYKMKYLFDIVSKLELGSKNVCIINILIDATWNVLSLNLVDTKLKSIEYKKNCLFYVIDLSFYRLF